MRGLSCASVYIISAQTCPLARMHAEMTYFYNALHQADDDLTIQGGAYVQLSTSDELH